MMFSQATMFCLSWIAVNYSGLGSFLTQVLLLSSFLLANDYFFTFDVEQAQTTKEMEYISKIILLSFAYLQFLLALFAFLQVIAMQLRKKHLANSFY